MARTSTVKLIEKLIQSEIKDNDLLMQNEVDTKHYGKACGYGKFNEGLNKALSIIRGCQSITTGMDLSGEEK